MTIDDIGEMILKESNHTTTRFGAMETRFEDVGKMIREESARTATQFDELARMIGNESSHIAGRFDAMETRFDSLEKRVMNIEAFTDEARGRFIGIDDRLAKVEYALDGASPRKLKKRTEKLEKKVFGSVQPA